MTETAEPLSLDASAAIARARRGRNRAMLVVLSLLAALFFALAFVKLAAPGAPNPLADAPTGADGG